MVERAPRAVLPHAAPEPEDDSTASSRITGLLKKALRNGVSQTVRFLLSLRVGSGTGLSGSDGQDGRIMANGPSAGFMLGDQGAPNNNQWAILTYVDPMMNVSSWRAGNQVQLNTQLLATLMKNSLRVGTGAGLSGNDGQDGLIIASGASAALLLGDTSNPGTNTSLILALTGVSAALRHSNGTQITLSSSNGAVSTPKSVRNGSGAGLAALDGLDGVFLSDGAMAAFIARHRDNAAIYFAWYGNGGAIIFGTNALTLWQISPSTGMIAQAALSALTPNTGVAIAAGFLASGSRFILPTGQVYLSISLQTSTTIAANGVVATVAAAHRPTGTVPLTFRSGVSPFSAVSGYLNAAGNIFVDQALASGAIIGCVVTYFP